MEITTMFGSNQENLQGLKDPFQKQCITDITIKMYTGMFTKRVYFTASISFTNGLTTGTHEIKDCENLTDAFIKAKTFVESL